MYGDDSPGKLFGTVLPIRPSMIRQMWHTPRGKDVARKIAYKTVSFLDFGLLPVLLTVSELFHQGAMPGKLTEEQDALLWQVAQEMYSGFSSRRVSTPQFVQILLTWKGTVNRLGWAGVAPALDPSLRGPLAYVMGRRFIRLKKPEQAADFFRQATDNAPPDSTLYELASAELARLKTD